MDRDKFTLDNNQWRELVLDGYLNIDGNEIETHGIETKYVASGRHTEHHYLIFKRTDNGKFYRVDFAKSVKDEMGWAECNHGGTEAVEVFPKEVITTIYE